MNQAKIDSVICLLENSLNFRVALSADEASKALQGFTPYNFIPNNIANLPAKVKAVFGGGADFPEGNPNKGTDCNLDFMVGNESSLVIYVTVKTYANKEKNPKVNRAALQSIGESFKADEITFGEREAFGGPFVTVRLWWD